VNHFTRLQKLAFTLRLRSRPVFRDRVYGDLCFDGRIWSGRVYFPPTESEIWIHYPTPSVGGPTALEKDRYDKLVQGYSKIAEQAFDKARESVKNSSISVTGSFFLNLSGVFIGPVMPRPEYDLVCEFRSEQISEAFCFCVWVRNQSVETWDLFD